MNGFKKSIESELKDLHVSEELKRKTLKKCKEKNKNLKVITATAASVAFLTISLIAYNNFYKKSSTQSVENSTENHVEINKNVVINSENVDQNKVVISDNSRSNEEKDSDKVVKNSEQASIDINLNNSNVKETDSKKVLSNDVVSNSYDTKIEKTKETDNNDKLIDKHTEKENKINVASATPTVKKNIETKSNLVTTSQSISIEDAERFLSKKIVLPLYIPDGYSVSSMEKYEEKNICILIKYSLNSNYFYIKESKIDSKLDQKDKKDIKLSNKEIIINWIYDGLSYSVGGNLSKDEIQKIADSIK